MRFLNSVGLFVAAALVSASSGFIPGRNANPQTGIGALTRQNRWIASLGFATQPVQPAPQPPNNTFIGVSKKQKNLNNKKNGYKNTNLRTYVLRNNIDERFKEMELIQEKFSEAQNMANVCLQNGLLESFTKEMLTLIFEKYKTIESVEDMSEEDFMAIFTLAVLADMYGVYKDVNPNESRLKPMFEKDPEEKFIYFHDLSARIMRAFF